MIDSEVKGKIPPADTLTLLDIINLWCSVWPRSDEVWKFTFFSRTMFSEAALSTFTSSSDFLHFPEWLLRMPTEKACLCRWRETVQYDFPAVIKSDWWQKKLLGLLPEVKYQNLTLHWYLSGIKVHYSCTQGSLLIIWSSGARKILH